MKVALRIALSSIGPCTLGLTCITPACRRAALPRRPTTPPLSSLRPSRSYTPPTQNPPSSGRHREGFSSVSISLDDFFDFTSGDQDPLFDISQCSIQQPTCSSLQANVSSLSSHRDNSEQLPSHHGQPPISWDHDFNFTTAASSSALPDTSLPLASTSLFPTLTATGNTLYDTTDWNSLQLPTAASEPFTGNALQHNLASGGPPLVLTAEEQISLLAMVPATQASFDMSLSTPMEPNRSQSGSSSTTFHNRSSYSPEHSPNTRMSNSTKSSPPTEPPSKVEKRRANTLAARRYRQKRVDQMSGLEAELKEVKAERDEWKVRCAKLEGEVEALRALLRSQK